MENRIKELKSVRKKHETYAIRAMRSSLPPMTWIVPNLVDVAK
jgi:hypothetical protein